MKQFLMIAALATITTQAQAGELMPPTVAACIKAFDGMPEQARLKEVARLTGWIASPTKDVKVSLDFCREALIATEQDVEMSRKKVTLILRQLVLNLCEAYITTPMAAEVASPRFKELMIECER